MSLVEISEIFSCICKPVSKGFYYLCCCFSNNFECEICEKRFISKHHLASHIRNTHSEIFVWGN